MIQSLNTKVDLTIKGTSFVGFTKYGKIMVGDKAFEFYNDNNIADYIQIPYDEVDRVIASVIFNGKWIPRFALITKKDGQYTFSSSDNKKVLKEISKYIAKERMLKSWGFFKTVKRGFLSLFKK